MAVCAAMASVRAARQALVERALCLPGWSIDESHETIAPKRRPLR
ncbi:MAG TPA: hypothetical protein VF998_04840 [Candidatus Limnocylindria bacterium]